MRDLQGPRLRSPALTLLPQYRRQLTKAHGYRKRPLADANGPSLEETSKEGGNTRTIPHCNKIHCSAHSARGKDRHRLQVCRWAGYAAPHSMLNIRPFCPFFALHGLFSNAPRHPYIKVLPSGSPPRPPPRAFAPPWSPPRRGLLQDAHTARG